MDAITMIIEHAEKIRSGEHDRIGPGRPVTMSTALQAGECVAQGDLYLVVIDRVPVGHTKLKCPTASDRQLVPGNTEGAKHCLDSLDGVTIYRRDDWGPESLNGPVLRTSSERVVEHPKHGHVTIPAGMLVACHYQREWDAEQARERRSAD